MTTKRIVKKRSRKPVDPNKALVDILIQVKDSGYCSIKLSSLFHRFGYQKRGPSNVEAINQYFKELGLYAYPQINMKLSWDRQIRIYDFPVAALGDLFKSENMLEEFIIFSHEYQQLDIVKGIQQYRPMSTKDRLDFRGIDKDGKLVVLELKNKEGGKSAVQQVLKYAGMLKRENPEAIIRKILVTGLREIETAKTIQGMTKEEKEGFEWYVYNYNSEAGKITFERVKNSFIDEHLPHLNTTSE
jgi:hypothetical protein